MTTPEGNGEFPPDGRSTPEGEPLAGRLIQRVLAPEGLTSDELGWEAATLIQHYESLTVDYGIQTAGFREPLVTRDAQGVPMLVVVRDEVEGEAYDHSPSEPIPEAQRNAAARLARRLSGYYFDRMLSQRPILQGIFDLRHYRFLDDTFTLDDRRSDLFGVATMDIDAPFEALKSLTARVSSDEEFGAWRVAMMNARAIVSVPASERLGQWMRHLPPPPGPEES
jgi:hypothetical protein